MDDEKLSRLIELVSDKSAHPAFIAKYGNADQLSRALLRAVYEDKRKRQQDEFADLVYLENYCADYLSRRPFICFGPGHFRHKYWKTADKIYTHNGGKLWSETRDKGYKERIDYVWDMFKREPIPVEDCSVEIAYASHIVEHAYNADNEFFFNDVRRILRDGGIFRLTAPNIDLGLRAAREKDYTYYGQSQFLRGGKHRERVLGKGGSEGNRYPIEYYVVESCSLLAREGNSTLLTPEQCIEFLWADDDVYKTLDKASEMSDRRLNEIVAAHVNWFNPEKVIYMLRKAGFSNVILSAYGQSVSPILRDTRYFDNTNPRVSWYVDAVR